MEIGVTMTQTAVTVSAVASPFSHLYFLAFEVRRIGAAYDLCSISVYSARICRLNGMICRTLDTVSLDSIVVH